MDALGTFNWHYAGWLCGSGVLFFCMGIGLMLLVQRKERE